MLANLLHVGMGNRVPARCKGLKDRRVAVVCLSGSSSFGSTKAAGEIARSLERRLEKNVKGIEVISQQEIDDWRDRNEWNEIDYLELGRGVSAETVLAVNLGSFSLHDGPTLFKGRCDVEMTVYDLLNEGNIVYDSTPTQVQFPINTGQHVTDTREREFRNKFIEVVASELSHYFYAYLLEEDYGRDAEMLTVSGR